MSAIITGIVTNGVIVPSTPLPEGTHVQIRPQFTCPEVTPALQAEFDSWERAGAGTIEMVERDAEEIEAKPRLTASELLKLPREERQAFLAASAALAEDDYRNDKNLTGFDAFSAEEFDVENNANEELLS